MITFAEDWDKYQGDADAMEQTALGYTSFKEIHLENTRGANTGEWYARFTGFNEVLGINGVGVALPTPRNEVFVHGALRVTSTDPNSPAFPNDDWTAYPFGLRDSGGNALVTIRVTSTGQLEVLNSAGSQVGITSALVLNLNSWDHISIRVVLHSSTGSVELRVNEVTVLNLTGLNLGSTACSTVQFGRIVSAIGAGGMDMDDLVVNDATGTYNVSWLGQVRVSYINLRRDDPNKQGWGDAHPRYKYRITGLLGDDGAALYFPDGNAGAVTAPDAAAFELGSGDFTAEGWFKFIGLPTGGASYYLFGKFQTGSNQRSYALRYNDTNKCLEWEISTNGTATTTIFSVPWVPIIGFWYHIAVVRSSSETSLFVDGLRMVPPKADANTYFNGTAAFSLGNRMSATTTADNVGFIGYIDEFRLTPGVVRYTTSFVPATEAFPRSVVAGDASFASVALLIGADVSVTDESGTPNALTVRGNAQRLAVAELLPGNFKSLNNVSSHSFVAAKLLPAYNILLFDALPSNGDTVTVDGKTYTFETAFSDTAGSILIGASVSAAIQNLVAAINGEAGEGTVYGTGTSQTASGYAYAGDDSMFWEANVPGSAGNSIATTETGSNLAWSAGAACIGGTDLPDPSEFILGRIPPQISSVKAIIPFTRSGKSDSGSAKLQVTFKTGLGGTAAGADRPVSTSFTYYGDIIEEDPDTTSNTTANTLLGGIISLDRTV